MLDQNTIPTTQEPQSSGFVFKKEDALQGVVTSVSETRHTQFLTWQISRIMRRDFYVLTSCMFRRAKSAHYHTAIQHCLEDLRDEVNLIEHRTANIEMPEAVVHSEADVHIRSHAALELYLILTDYDRAMFKFQQHVAKEAAEAVLANFTALYSELKRTVIPPRENEQEHAGREQAPAKKDPD